VANATTNKKDVTNFCFVSVSGSNRGSGWTAQPYPAKLGVVHSNTRSWSLSMLKNWQFSHPESLNWNDHDITPS